MDRNMDSENFTEEPAENAGEAGTTALALSGNSFTGRILQPADFQALDGLIKALGDKSANLAPEEKTGAVAIIDEWNKSVTERIRANEAQARQTLEFLEGTAMYGGELEECIELFHEVLGDTPEYLRYKAAVDNYAAVMADAPLDNVVDDSMTVAQAEQVNMDNYAERLKYNRRLKAAEHAFNKAVKDYIKYLNALPEILALKGSLRSYKNKASRMAADCQDKATRAKLNITISDPDVRKLLHDMMDFTKTV